MREILLISILTLLTTLQTKACNCGLESIQAVRDRSIDQSDFIFVAKVIFIDTTEGYFTLKILKVYKGAIDGEVQASSAVDSLGTLSSCGFWPSPYWGDEFIVYANRVKGAMRIYIDDCSATRSVSNPNIHLSYASDRQNDRRQRGQAKRDLREEIKILKKLKEQ